MPGPFPFSAGTAAAQTPLPPGACDCHIHVYDDSVAPVAGAALRPPQATVADYRRIQARMGTQRAVLVTPSTYGCNNAPMLAGLAQLGEHGRGVAVISGEESDKALQALHQQGVRGVRINLSLGQGPEASAIEPIAQRIAPLGWHLQLLMPVDQLLALAPLLRRLPVDLVFDHFARIATTQAGQHPAHALVLDLLLGGRAWLKLSGGYLVSATHSVDDPALDALAHSFIEAAPERMVWGSDWPHATASAGRHPYPDDARQVERLAQWAGDAETLGRIMVSNPERLYGFDPFPTP
ncbi:MAG: amidohydrolase family protein [Caldimonas manganoxidans]|nr:amidohydrolase family protein [Caldimonas manganoxidans]